MTTMRHRRCTGQSWRRSSRTRTLHCNARNSQRHPLPDEVGRLQRTHCRREQHGTRGRQVGGGCKLSRWLENEVSRETRGGRAPAGPLGPAQQHTTLGVNSRWARTGWGRREAPRRCCRNVEWRARTPVCRTLGPGRRPCTLDTGHCTAQGVGEGQVEAWVPQKSHAFPEGSDGRVGERYTHTLAPGLGQ